MLKVASHEDHRCGGEYHSRAGVLLLRQEGVSLDDAPTDVERWISVKARGDYRGLNGDEA